VPTFTAHVRILIALVIASTGCLVTRAPKLEERPRWRHIGKQEIDTPCASGRAFVRKSGKQGVGLTLMWKSRMDCVVEIETVHVAFDAGERLRAPNVAEIIELPGRSLRYTWLAVGFDNNRAWNDEHNTATVDIVLTTTPGGANRRPPHNGPDERTTWRISMEQR
jgi:hypothetical protein